MPTKDDLDKMTALFVKHTRFDEVASFEMQARIMELTIAALHVQAVRYK